MSNPDNTAKIVATRNGLRLVHKQREPHRWPNTSDLTLEQERIDATGETHWVYVDSWRLSPRSTLSHGEDNAVIALKMILDSGTVLEKKP